MDVARPTTLAHTHRKRHNADTCFANLLRATLICPAFGSRIGGKITEHATTQQGSPTRNRTQRLVPAIESLERQRNK